MGADDADGTDGRSPGFSGVPEGWVVVMLMVRVRARPSRPKPISMPTLRKNVAARRNLPANDLADAGRLLKRRIQAQRIQIKRIRSTSGLGSFADGDIFGGSLGGDFQFGRHCSLSLRGGWQRSRAIRSGFNFSIVAAAAAVGRRTTVARAATGSHFSANARHNSSTRSKISRRSALESVNSRDRSYERSNAATYWSIFHGVDQSLSGFGVGLDPDASLSSSSLGFRDHRPHQLVVPSRDQAVTVAAAISCLRSAMARLSILFLNCSS
jgi:hypothetical protein